jgi:hypothetical protein
MVMLVLFEVVLQSLNIEGQQSNLNFGRSGITFTTGEVFNDLGFFLNS